MHVLIRKCYTNTSDMFVHADYLILLLLSQKHTQTQHAKVSLFEGVTVVHLLKKKNIIVVIVLWKVMRDTQVEEEFILQKCDFTTMSLRLHIFLLCK